LYRLFVANSKSKLTVVTIVLYQAVLELVLRTTLFRREQAMQEAANHVKRCCVAQANQELEKRRKRTVITVENISKVSPASVLSTDPYDFDDFGEDEKEKITRVIARRDFVSMIVLIDMMAEYVGIASSSILLASFSDKPLSSPYLWYIENALGKGKEELDRTSLIFTTLIQVVMEVLVDGACLYFERETDPYSIWKSLDKRKFVPLFLMASWYGTILANALFNSGDSFAKCSGANMCLCVNHGLAKGGVLEAYCHLIYPNATWSLTFPPLLGPHIGNTTGVSP
jgi:hypothetical protein